MLHSRFNDAVAILCRVYKTNPGFEGAQEVNFKLIKDTGRILCFRLSSELTLNLVQLSKSNTAD